MAHLELNIAVFSVAPAQPVFEFGQGTRPYTFAPGILHVASVFRVNGVQPAGALVLLEGLAGKSLPRGVLCDDVAVSRGLPDHRRGGG
jgi:hypothetical protein